MSVIERDNHIGKTSVVLPTAEAVQLCRCLGFLCILGFYWLLWDIFESMVLN